MNIDKELPAQPLTLNWEPSDKVWNPWQTLGRWKARRLVWVYLALALAALLFAMPFYYMLITTFKSTAELAHDEVSLWVQNPTLDPLRRLLNGTAYLHAAWNSFVIAVVTTLGNMLLCPLAGYAFAKHRFPGRDRIFFLLLSTMMVPGAVLLVPNFILARDFGWVNTYWPLIVPGLASIFYVFLARQFISKIPRDLIQAARMDGCSEWRIFFQIILPLCRPLLASIGILSFLGSWNGFIGPMIYLLDEDRYTIPLVISMLQGRFGGQENVQMAGSLLSIVPALIFFFIFQKQIVSSFANSGLKE
ncbi:MAG TPA: carbohydrate ABC transporter permease [Oligoflexus sp.]|uniref:carbohydrate ABC transporter permease n=1 Tax=Oligoflexus sp. TaxID=1971216 RepID=UPI002D3C41CF|nr:carbohydrate ABC transporter permease [Oligoflexus sp.]HYX36416.1 carbohydrate ABC transporter permease [Oligoflexus sp.]